MTEPLDRNKVIELLNRLGSERDEELVDAARQLHADVTAAGMGWEDLLVPDGPQNDEEKHGTEEDTDTEPAPIEKAAKTETPQPAADASGDAGDTRAMIDELLARTDISETLREELEDYKTDEIEAADARYVQAVHARLTAAG